MQTQAACAALGLPVWDDPHNSDHSFRRIRLRREVLPLLEDVLAGGVTEALARTASQLQADLDTLDQIAGQSLAAALTPQGLRIDALAGQPDGIVSRCLKMWAELAGAGPLTAPHVIELWRLVHDWHGQGPIDLPGGFRVVRSSGTLRLVPPVTGYTSETTNGGE
jgi:tRNA(Ile)-lysidine synthase